MRTPLTPSALEKCQVCLFLFRILQNFLVASQMSSGRMVVNVFLTPEEDRKETLIIILSTHLFTYLFLLQRFWLSICREKTSCISCDLFTTPRELYAISLCTYLCTYALLMPYLILRFSTNPQLLTKYLNERDSDLHRYDVTMLTFFTVKETAKRNDASNIKLLSEILSVNESSFVLDHRRLHFTSSQFGES